MRRYLEDHVPSLSVLPVKVSVNILSKNIQIPDVILKPHDGYVKFFEVIVTLWCALVLLGTTTALTLVFIGTDWMC